MFDPVRRRRRQLVPVERGVGPRDDRPRVRVGGRFAGEVSGVELLEGGVDVVEVERDARHDPLVGVDLDDAEHLACGTPRAHGRGPRSGYDEDEAFSAGRNDGRRYGLVTPTSAIARMFAISASRPCRIPAFTTRRRSSLHMSSASISAIAVPVAGREVRQKRSHTWLAAFSSRGAGRLQLIEPRERGVEVCLVEHLAAVDQVAFDRQEVDHPPLGVEALLRGPMCRMGDDRSEVAQADARPRSWMLMFGAMSHAARRYAVMSPGANAVARRWSMFTQSGVVGGISCRLNAA